MPGGRDDRGDPLQDKDQRAGGCKASLFERQATAILEMRLYKLIGLEIEALQAD